MASACCNMMRAASSNQFVAGRHADRSPLARLQLFTREIVRAIFRRVPQWRPFGMGERAHRSTIHDGLRRAARSCDVSALTRGLTAVLRVIFATIRFSIVHTQPTRCAVVHRRPHRPRDPPTRDRVRSGGRRARRRARPRRRGARAGSRDATTRTDNRISNRMSSPSAERVRAHEHARPSPARKRATRLDANRRLDYPYLSVECVARATCTSDVDDACAREPTAKHSQTHDTTSRHASGRYPTLVHACIYTHLTHANTPAASTERTPAGTGFCAFLGATAHFCAKGNAAQRVLQGNAAACRRPPRPLGAQ